MSHGGEGTNAMRICVVVYSQILRNFLTCRVAGSCDVLWTRLKSPDFRSCFGTVKCTLFVEVPFQDGPIREVLLYTIYGAMLGIMGQAWANHTGPYIKALLLSLRDTYCFLTCCTRRHIEDLSLSVLVEPLPIPSFLFEGHHYIVCKGVCTNQKSCASSRLEGADSYTVFVMLEATYVCKYNHNNATHILCVEG